MKGRWKDRHAGYKKGTIAVLCIVFVLAAGAAGFGLTKEKFQKLPGKSTREVQAENFGAGIMEINPLNKNDDSDISAVIREYYKEAEEKEDFAEAYENIEVYTKSGKYKDTYVVFARYEMKVKDIYTKVPGLETFYVEKDEKDGGYRIHTGTLDEKTQKLIQTVTGHEDVQTLLKETEKEYKEAVQSDALLREALTDLQNAFGDSKES